MVIIPPCSVHMLKWILVVSSSIVFLQLWFRTFLHSSFQLPSLLRLFKFTVCWVSLKLIVLLRLFVFAKYHVVLPRCCTNHSNKSFFTKYLVARFYRVVFQDLPHCCTKYPLRVLLDTTLLVFITLFFRFCHILAPNTLLRVFSLDTTLLVFTLITILLCFYSTWRFFRIC